MLEIRDLRGGYDQVEVLRGISMTIGAGEIVAVLGSNGAGKSTLNNTLCGIIPSFGGAVHFDGRDVTRSRYTDIVAAGLIQVPEGRRIFPNLTVLENLELGSYLRGRGRRAQNLERAFAIFPRLRERVAQRAGTLSGGEQQMLAMGRGLMAEARLLMMDEPSLGLSPLFVQYIFEIIDKLHANGLTILLVEQNLMLTLRHAQRCYVLERGHVAVEGTADIVRDDPRTRSAYLGL